MCYCYHNIGVFSVKQFYVSLIIFVIFFSFQLEATFSCEYPNDFENPLKRQMLYLPQREPYSSSNAEGRIKQEKVSKPCIFCKLLQEKNDRKNLLLTRFKFNSVWLALYPYNKGHLLIIPNKHIKDLDDLEMPAKIELMQIISKVGKILKNSLDADGANIGINIGKISGASKPDHIHVHVVPRYVSEHPSNITPSFIHIIGETKVTQWDLTKLYDDLKPKFDVLKDFLDACLMK